MVGRPGVEEAGRDISRDEGLPATREGGGGAERAERPVERAERPAERAERPVEREGRVKRSTPSSDGVVASTND